MLGKLMKYEWKGFRFPLLIMFIVLAGTTLLTCCIIFTINPEYDEAVFGYSIVALILSALLYYFGIIGCTLGTTLIIAIRFYKTCYTDQGYLTHTLPVSTNQIFNAKLLAAILANLLMFLLIAASVFLVIQVAIYHIMSVSPYEYEDLRRSISYEISSLSREFKRSFGISFSLYILYLVAYYIIMCIANLVILFGCVSLGQLYAKHRIIGAIIAYFASLFIRQIFAWIASIPMYIGMLNNSHSTAFQYMSPTFNLTLLFTVALAAAMYFVNLHMLTKKLNLE